MKLNGTEVLMLVLISICVAVVMFGTCYRVDPTCQTPAVVVPNSP